VENKSGIENNNNMNIGGGDIENGGNFPQINSGGTNNEAVNPGGANI
jgi:hypothetical protein